MKDRIGWDLFTIAVPLRNRWLPYYTHEYVGRTSVLQLPPLSPAVKTGHVLPCQRDDAMEVGKLSFPVAVESGLRNQLYAEVPKFKFEFIARTKVEGSNPVQNKHSLLLVGTPISWLSSICVGRSWKSTLRRPHSKANSDTQQHQNCMLQKLLS